jgi:hypothetical protein
MEEAQRKITDYRWIPHNAGFSFLDIAGPTLGVFASLDRL